MQGQLKIHTQNILPIIKKWLYSDKEIFVRELVSNATDALQKLKRLCDLKEAENDAELRIDITVDKEKKLLKISDTGIGMNCEEVEKYIAQVAFSGAEEFAEKYQTASDADPIIGHFGLGFYSSYMVAKLVEIQTKSYRKEEKGALWVCDGGVDYTLEQTEKETRGTEITLHIDAESEEFLEEVRIRTILEKYCSFLPYPIYLNGSLINASEPLWLKSPSQCTDDEYLNFYRKLYPMDPDPVFWVHLTVDYPFNLKAILYFPKITRRFDWQNNQMRLFSNRVYVADSCKEIIPDFMQALRGAIDSPDIPLNVSRSTLQMDKTVRQLATHLTKKIADRLTSLSSMDRPKYEQIWKEIELIVKLGILQEDKFAEKMEGQLLFYKLSSKESSATLLQEYLDLHKDKHPIKFYYATEEHISSSFLDLYQSKGIEIFAAGGPVDSAIMGYLERKHSSLKFQRIDGAIDDAILDPSKEKGLLDSEGRSEAFNVAQFFSNQLKEEGYEVEAKSLSSSELPGFVVVDEEERRFKEYFALTNPDMPVGRDAKKLVVNTNNGLVNAIYGLKESNPTLAKDLVKTLLDLSLLSQKELKAQEMPNFVDRCTKLLEKLSSTIS